jgi:DDE superfamily endonuclease
MPAIIEFPTLVQHAVEQFGTVFANEPERRHFAEYLTGLLVAEQKTVSGMNAEFAQTTDQSCLNRWITEVDWDAAQLNEQRLAWLQQDPQTRSAPSGVIPIDNPLVDHAGKLIADVGYFWDHAEQRHKIAHDYLIANYVCPAGKH